MKNCIKTTLICLLTTGIFTSCEAFKPLSATPLVVKDNTEPTTTVAANAAKADKEILISQLRFDILDYAKQFVGVRYRHGCRNPEVGFDCSGFTSYVLKNFDVKVSPSSGDQSHQGVSIDFDSARPGDLIFFGRNGHISHVGMVAENYGQGLHIIHASSSRGVVIENISNSNYWQRKLMFAKNVLGD